MNRFRLWIAFGLLHIAKFITEFAIFMRDITIQLADYIAYGKEGKS
jgi:hypothetical protein